MLSRSNGPDAKFEPYPDITYGTGNMDRINNKTVKTPPATQTQKMSSLPRLEILDESTASKPDNYRISPASVMPDWDKEMKSVIFSGERGLIGLSLTDHALNELESFPAPCDPVDKDDVDILVVNWLSRGDHVEFQDDEEVPLIQGRFLGHGSMGSVFETSIGGLTFAWKRRFCRRGIGMTERKELDILKKMSHRHIIQLACSYTHRLFLGLLLFPVATCDLATFFEDSEAISTNRSASPASEERLVALGLLDKTPERLEFRWRKFISSRMGCFVSAIDYLHRQRIRHKDLKPSNVLLSTGNIWLTDFGTATDFSDQTISTTENCERGTPKYFAPEMANFDKCGRPADIFSLGCVLLEMHTLQQVQTLQGLRDLRQKHDKSFQANLDHIHDWLSRPAERDLLCDHQVKYQIRTMLARDPAKRPTIGHVRTMFALIDTFSEQTGNDPFFGNCCRELFISKEEHERGMQDAKKAAETERDELRDTITTVMERNQELSADLLKLQTSGVKYPVPSEEPATELEGRFAGPKQEQTPYHNAARRTISNGGILGQNAYYTESEQSSEDRHIPKRWML